MLLLNCLNWYLVDQVVSCLLIRCHNLGGMAKQLNIESVGSMPLQLLEVGFHVEIHAIEWHDFQRETQFHGVVAA